MLRTFLAAGAALMVMAGACAAVAPAPGSRLAGHMAGKIDTGRTIVLEADVACPADRAYAMWSTSAGAQSFFAPNAEIGGLGAGYTVMFFPDDDPRGMTHGTAGAHVLAAEPGRFYAFEWVVFAGDALKGNNAPPYADESLRRPDPLPTWVELTFTPTSEGTHIAFRHYGFGEGALYAQSQAWFTRAWSGVLTQMRAACAR